MTNELTRAWELLTPEQRPEGMRFVSEDDCDGGYDHWVENEPQDPAHTQQVSRASAYDRLCQAVEGVLLKARWWPVWNFGAYCWGRDGNDIDYQHPDRLTAANNALEACRSKP